MRVKLLKNQKRAVQSVKDCTAPFSVRNEIFNFTGGGYRVEICRRLFVGSYSVGALGEFLVVGGGAL